MKSRTLPAFMLAALLGTAGCAADRAALERLEDEQARQARLLAAQNMLLAEQSVLLAELIDSHLQATEMLADVDRTVKENRRRAAARAQARAQQENGEEATPVEEPEVQYSEEGKVVLGRNEWAWVELLSRNLKARVDTGALSSSLSATDLQPFERDGQNWIRFRVPDEEHPEGGEIYEAPLERHVRIRQASATDLERRPVVKLKVRVGTLSDDTEFTLTNRENMLYPILLGRNFLRDVAVVDVAQVFVQQKHVPVPNDADDAE